MEFEELLLNAKAGDQEALEKLFMMYRPLLLARATVGDSSRRICFKSFL